MYYRSKQTNTGRNADLIVNTINDPSVNKITLFATERFSDDSNSPLMVALVEQSLPSIDEIVYVVFDTNVSTAQRLPRYLEVKRILEAAQSSDKVYFSHERAPYTANVSPEEAIKSLFVLNKQELLSEDSRPQFFSLLSNLTEVELRKAFKLTDQSN
jgi:hypothetical protein